MLEQAPPSAAGAPVTCQGATADSRDKLNTLVESRPRLEMLKILFFFLFLCICEAGPVWTSTGRNLINHGHKGEPAGLWMGMVFSSVPGVVQKGVSSVPAPALRLPL